MLRERVERRKKRRIIFRQRFKIWAQTLPPGSLGPSFMFLTFRYPASSNKPAPRPPWETPPENKMTSKSLKREA